MVSESYIQTRELDNIEAKRSWFMKWLINDDMALEMDGESTKQTVKARMRI